MNWVLLNWRILLSGPVAHVALTLAAIVCGIVIGTEREKQEKPAGMRTLTLVSLGSAIFTMVSFAFGTTTGDTGRVAAQIVTGIGFLGAGVILHGQAAVSGITTAATIWATAAVGIVVGVGYAGAGLGLSVLIRLVLSGLVWWERRYVCEMGPAVVEVVVDLDHGKTQFRLECMLEEFHADKGLERLEGEESGTGRFRITVRLPRHHRAEFLSQLAQLPQVKEIRNVSSRQSDSLRTRH